MRENLRIKRIDVYRDYRVHIDFNIDSDQFQFGLDCRREEEVGKKPAWYNKRPLLRRERAAISISSIDGGDKRDRTADLLNAIQALSQANRSRTP